MVPVKGRILRGGGGGLLPTWYSQIKNINNVLQKVVTNMFIKKSTAPTPGFWSGNDPVVHKHKHTYLHTFAVGDEYESGHENQGDYS